MSNLINRTGLKKFADGFWTKIKGRYDNAFKEARISASDSDDKKITLTRVSGATVDVELTDYARLQDRNKFKKDVSVDNVGVVDNSHIGATPKVTSMRRGLGFRQLTTSAFVDGHVDHIKIYVDNTNTNTTSTWKVWAITKNATDRTQDRVKAVAFSGDLSVETVQENGQAKKIVNIPINKSYATETYFIVRCTTHHLLVIDDIDQKYRNDSVNLGDTNQPPDAPDSPINWDSNAEGANTAIIYLYGRESIGSLAEKLRQTQADGSNYVLKSETTATGGNGKAGKVAKLGADGKLDATMLPSIAVNDYFSVTAFTDEKLGALTYENGDVVVVENGGVVSKRYLCIHKGATNSTTEFVELNSKDGVVQSVNGKVGAITLGLEATDDKFKLNITSGGSTVATEVNIISDDEITEILNALPQ